MLLKPASPGTGVIAGGSVRAVMEAAGIKNVLTKSLRSMNAISVVRAALDALSKLRTRQEVAALRGRSMTEADAKINSATTQIVDNLD